MDTEPKLRRRRAGEVRQLLIASARGVFTRKGYSGSSTREIAEQAEVSEALLFRHFKSKANLFGEAILRPFNEFLRDFVTTWQSQLDQPWDDERLMREFVGHLYDVLRENRDLVLTLIAASAHDPDAVAEGAVSINVASMMDELAVIGSEEAARRGFESVDVGVAVRAVAGMVLSLAVLGQWTFGTGRRQPSRQRIVDEAVAIALYGVTQRPSNGRRSDAANRIAKRAGRTAPPATRSHTARAAAGKRAGDGSAAARRRG